MAWPKKLKRSFQLKEMTNILEPLLKDKENVSSVVTIACLGSLRTWPVPPMTCASVRE